MKEKNPHLLKEALQRLPQYEPKATLWDQIETSLDAIDSERDFKKQLGQLPNYSPPAQVWEQIQMDLDNTDTNNKPGKVVGLRRWMSIAAAILVLMTGGVWMFNQVNSNATQVAITYSEEKINPALLAVNWEEDEDAFAMVAELCKTQINRCKLPEVKIMTDELDELNAARTALKEAMDAYGNDPDLIAQLTDIEHERTDLLKKIIKGFRS